MPKENLFIAEDLDLDEQKKNDILSFIESCNNFQDFIKKLEEENLIWYFIGPLRKDEDIKEQINLQWENEFQKFEQSINETHKNFEASLPGENFLVYTTKDNDFKIRFENKEKPIEISALLRASDEGKVYNLSLGKNSQITATKKGSERHYDFTGSSSCKMTINWQAKDSKGNSVDCSMTVEVSSRGIERVIGEPKFEGVTDPEEALKLVEQNKEVFINGKTLHQAFTDMGKSVNEQQTPAEEIFTKDSPQSPIPSSSGYSSPGSRRSSFSTESEIGDEESEITDEYIDDGYDQQKMYKDYERKYEQEGLKGVDETINEINKLAEQRDDLILERDSLKNEVNEQRQAIFERDQKIEEQDASVKSLMEEHEKLKERNQKIEKEGDTEIRALSKGKQILEEKVIRLEDELKRKAKELAKKDQDIKQLELEVNVLKQSEKDKSARITYLINQLKDKESEIQSTNKELQKKLDQGESELSKLRAENARLKNNIEKIFEEGLKDNHEKLLVEELTEEKEKNNTLAKEMKLLSQEFNELQRKNEDLERKIQQLEPGRSLANELSEVNTKVATSTQTEVEYESRRTSMQQQDQDIQAINNNSSRIASGLRQENKKLTRDKLTISEQLKQKIKEIDELKKNLKQLQEENTQLRQKATKGTVVNASSLADQREAKEEEARTNIPQNIMDWPVPIPDDKPEEQKTPLELIKVNTELSDPNIVPAEASEKSTPSK